MVVNDNNPELVPTLLVGKWELRGGITTRLEINSDGSGAIVGSVWGKEPMTWSVNGNRLCVTGERGTGSADYAINDDNELVFSKIQGFILITGTYTFLAEEQQTESTKAIIW